MTKPEVGEIPLTAKGHLQFFQYVWRNSNPVNEEIYLKGLFNQILGCRKPEEFAYMLGWLSRAGVSSLVDIRLEEERRKPFYMRKTLSPSSLTLPMRYYLKPNYHSDPIWLAYIQYIAKCSIDLGLPYLINAIEAETEIANLLSIHSHYDSIKDVKGKELEKWLPTFCWPEYMEGLGFSGGHWRQEFWLIDDADCLKRILRWACTANDEKVVALLSLRLINLFAKHLRPSIQTAAFKLFDKELRGTKVPIPNEMRLIYNISDTLPDALCSEFAKVEYNPKKLERVDSLISGIKEGAIDTMSKNTSLTKRTTKLVLEKIRRMKINIGSPVLEDLPNAPYYPDSLIHTMMSISIQRALAAYTNAGHAASRRRLTYPCFTVNASYYEESNQIVIPWGILHCPFFCDNSPIGWNHGGTGATIAHEISHAFDIEGSQYNPQAMYKSWWTRKDRARFKQKTRKMSDFFSKHMRLGYHLNGKKTLSENWADFGGIVIALNALKRELLSMEASEETKKEAIKTFFIGYAVSWRDKMRKKKVLYNIMKSVHSLPEDRVDLIVPHFQEWVDAFDIKESDPLFIPVGKRLKFF